MKRLIYLFLAFTTLVVALPSSLLAANQYNYWAEKLRSGAVEERRDAAGQLRYHPKEGYDLLVSVGLKDEDAKVIRKSIMTLIEISTPKVTQHIAPFISSDDDLTQIVAGAALLNYGDIRGLSPLNNKASIKQWEDILLSSGAGRKIYHYYVNQALSWQRNPEILKKAVKLLHESDYSYVKKRVKDVQQRHDIGNGDTKANSFRKHLTPKQTFTIISICGAVLFLWGLIRLSFKTKPVSRLGRAVRSILWLEFVFFVLFLFVAPFSGEGGIFLILFYGFTAIPLLVIIIGILIPCLKKERRSFVVTCLTLALIYSSFFALMMYQLRPFKLFGIAIN